MDKGLDKLGISEEDDILNKELVFENEEVDLSREGAIAEKEYKEKTEVKMTCLMSHNSSFKTKWDLIVILFAIYNCLSIPFNVAFSEMELDS